MQVKIFTEIGKDIGWGHITRTSAIVEELLKYKEDAMVEYIIYGDMNMIDKINNVKYSNVKWYNTAYLSEQVNSEDICIVDSYLANKKMYEIISSQSKFAIFIDDMARLNYPSATILNPSLYTDNLTYSNKDNTYLLGSEYIILRSPFLTVEKSKLNDDVKNILLTLGGSSFSEEMGNILTYISNKLPNVRFNVVGDTRIEINSSQVKYYKSLTPGQMKDKMMSSDLCITGAGQTIYELMKLGIPFIPIKLVNNQENNISGLKKLYSSIRVIDINENYPESIYDEVLLMMPLTAREEFNSHFNDAVDGLGVKRIVKYIIQEGLTIRKANPADAKDIYELSNEDYVRKHSISKNKIAWNDHLEWYENVLKNDDIVFYIITNAKHEFLGQVRFNLNNNEALISVSFTNKLKGKGYGSEIINESLKKLKKEYSQLRKIVAIINEENIASIKVFEKSGFNYISETNDGFGRYEHNGGIKNEN